MFGQKMKKQRLKLSKSIEQLAVECECSAGYIKELEKGIRSPSAKLTSKLEKSLKLTNLARQIPGIAAEKVKLTRGTRLELIWKVIDADPGDLKKMKDVLEQFEKSTDGGEEDEDEE